jgi:hypothetical protein
MNPSGKSRAPSASLAVPVISLSFLLSLRTLTAPVLRVSVSA